MVERTRLAIAAAIAALPVAWRATPPAGGPEGAALSAGRLVQVKAFPSRHVAERPIVAWLPPDLPGSNGPCAVLYMHDGQNLFAPANPMGHGPWDVDRHLLALMAQGRIRRTMVVGIGNAGLDRSREYAPAAAIRRLPRRLRRSVFRSSSDGRHAPLADAYLRFVTEELKPRIDREFATRPGRDDTFIMGSSMGGLVSLYALACRPEVFGGAGCLSTHWPVTTQPPLLMPSMDPKVEHIAGAFLGWLGEHLPVAGSHRLYFDRGTENLDSLYGPFQERMDALAREKGYRTGVDLLTRVFAGADHNERAWRERLAEPLAFLLQAPRGA